MTERRCGRCGRPLSAGDSNCSYCQAGIPRWRREAAIIISLVAIGVVLFFVAWLLTRTFERRRDALARRWFKAGQQALSASQPQVAVADLRTALFYKNSDLYRLRLAEALAAAHYTDQAKAYLLNLWEERPGSGNINLELARIAVSQKNSQEAVRYYQGAIYGVWDSDAIEHRFETRLELIHFLLEQNQSSAAYAEITSLAASIPADNPQMRSMAAELFACTGDFGNALAQYEQALQKDRQYFPALSGAAQAAFKSGRFRLAKHYLDEALQQRPNDASLLALRQQASLVLASDPFARHLPGEQQVRRTLTAFNQAGVRLAQCGAPVSLPGPTGTPGKLRADAQPTGDDHGSELSELASEWNKMRPGMNARSLSSNADLLENGMDLVSRIEQAPAKTCGSPTGLDWALLQLANYGSEVER